MESRQSEGSARYCKGQAHLSRPVPRQQFAPECWSRSPLRMSPHTNRRIRYTRFNHYDPERLHHTDSDRYGERGDGSALGYPERHRQAH